MLVRVRGAIEGIGKYLKEGHKAGREHSRDELDERLILAGDLDITDAIINSLDGTGQLYNHITLSFKEDFIPEETLAAIVEDFRAFAMSAFREEEYNFYAEAHLPKIKSLINNKEGKLYERKPHIHILIPKVNLLTGKRAEPFGFFKLSEEHIAAWQQKINNQYGLADPQDNRRYDFTDASEMISRYKGDTFDGANKELRGRILDAVLSRKIESYEQFSEMLKEFGAVRQRNSGKPNQYANVKPADSPKGINLKDYVFSREFLALSIEDKRRYIATEDHRTYQAAAAPRKTSAECEAILKDWHERRAKEVKYLNSGYTSLYERYSKQMNRDQKIAFLAERELRFYQRHLGADYGRDTTDRTDARAAAFERIGDNLRSSSADLAAARGAAGNLDRAAGNLADRAAIRAVATALERRAGNQRQSRAPAQHGAERAANGVVGRYRRELDERRAVGQAAKGGEFGEIKQHLEAGRLLAHLSKSHGVIVEKYEVTRGKDGSERIKCGNRNLNVSDFLTKEMSLPWKDAAPILREVYAAQRGRVHHQAKQAPNRELWAKYQDWKKNDAPHEQREAKRQIRAAHKEAIAQATKEFNAARSRIEGDRTLARGEAKRLIDIAKATREHAKKEARDSRNVALAAEREKWSEKEGKLYKRFLAEAAQTTDPYAEAALDELRKHAPDVAEKEDAASYIKAADQNAKEQGAPIKREMRYSVDLKGHVTYKIDGREALKDEGKRVNILRASDGDVIEQGLYLAKAKFGKVLTLHGSDEFKAEAVRIAVEKIFRSISATSICSA
ncbi:LPD7 domain-containing protein [Pseudoduganella danionis]|uniref:LPD7 domain-containing protein n=1 Tax=Pseudoduganella danionis TaxID=1890295 RepID=UPI0036089FBC